MGIAFMFGKLFQFLFLFWRETVCVVEYKMLVQQNGCFSLVSM